MNKQQLVFWKSEREMLDRLYRDRMRDWQRLTDLYDLKFDQRIRDLDPQDLVRVSRFYPILRQIVSQINHNTTQRQQLEAAYQQTAGAIAGLYEFAPYAEAEAKVEAPAENGQAELEQAGEQGKAG